MTVPAYGKFPGPLTRECSDNWGQRVRPSGGSYARREGHGGCDLKPSSPGQVGQNIRAAWAGRVIDTWNVWGVDYGRQVLIRHYAKHTHRRSNGTTYSHTHTWYSFYAHLRSIKVSRGQRVARAQVIGTLGNTGSSTAPHCHHEVHLDPRWAYGNVPCHGRLERRRQLELANR